mgnify:CR=1 FL=1
MPARIVEWQLPYTWGTGIEIDANKVISLLLREENNLILVNSDNEIYTDLQFASWLTPNSDFPVWVTVWKVLQSDWWTQSGLVLNWKTTSGDYARWIYANDWKLYFDNGTGTWKQVYYSSEVDTLITNLQSYVDNNFQHKLIAWPWITIDQSTNIISATWWGGGWGWDVYWPASATDWHVAVFDGITGKMIKDGWALPTQVTVVDALNSTSTTSALSANQWKVLDDKIADLQAMGRFLSLWDSVTGLPVSFPLSTPYTYKTWDYYLVSAVSSANPPVNYKPNGSSYTGTASSTTESDEVEVGDMYIYDGSAWLLQLNHGKSISFSEIAGQPSDNANLATALNAKANTADVMAKAIKVTVSTAYNTAAKTWTTTWGSYSPAEWDLLMVNFVNWCLVNTPTLNIDGSWAKNIKSGSANVWVSDFDLWSTSASNVKVLMYYDGNSYKVWSTMNTTYSSMSSNEAKTGTANNARSISASTLKTAILYHAPVPQDGTLTITQNWVTAGTFTANQSSATTIALTDTVYNSWPWINVGTIVKSDMQWPCEIGFHVPLASEWTALITAGQTLWAWTSTGWVSFTTKLHLPYAGARNRGDSSASPVQVGSRVCCHCADLVDSWGTDYAQYLNVDSLTGDIQVAQDAQTYWWSIRPFANTPVVPDSNWTTVYAGTWDAGIFYNATLWLISISSDGTTWITIADKNVWATEVWDYGDTESQANSGNYYQRWNNYGFPFTWTISTVYWAQVDATGYWPSNPYYSDVFVTYDFDEFTVVNYNLRWATSQGTQTYTDAITNMWVTSVNWQTGDVILNSGGDVLVSSQANNILTTGMKIWAGTEANYQNLWTYDNNTIYLTI